MRWRDLIILFLIALGVLLVASRWVSSPGYMDADYYFAGGLQLAGGKGFQEPFLWNYLDQPAGLPHPSHTYWMPLASLVSAAGMALGQSLTFRWGQAPFVILAALIPPLTAQLAYRFTRKTWCGWVAGLLGVFSGYYLNLLVNTETFTLYMVLGAVFFLLAFPETRFDAGWRVFLLGLVAGLLHLSRADGLIWLAGAVVVIVWQSTRSRLERSRILKQLALVVVGYLLIMAPWYARNLSLFDSLFAPGGSRTLWLTEYNQTFSFPADRLSPFAWWSAGILAHIKTRLWALGFNLKNFIGAQTLVVLAPMALLGAYRLRKKPAVVFTVGMWLLTLVIMTIVFPFAGARGGFLHSGAAVQPVIWAISPVGLAALIDIGVRRRGWDGERSFKVFSIALIVIAGFITLGLFWNRVIGPDPANPIWGAEAQRYSAIDRALREMGLGDQDIVMVNNPPGFYLATGRPSIVIPGGELESVLSAGQYYDARVLVLEAGQENLLDLYSDPRAPVGLTYEATIEGAHIFTLSTASAAGDQP